MSTFVTGLIGVVIGAAAGLTAALLVRRKRMNAFRTKEEHLAKLKELIRSTNEIITNDLVQDELGVSDATATRYLNELEKEGILKQVGDSGQGVYYQKV